MAIYGTVEGRLWKDAETFTFGDGKVGLRIPLVSNHSRAYAEENPEGTFVNGTLWRGGDKLAAQFVKGRQVVLIGEIQQLKDSERNNYNMQINVDQFVLGVVPGSSNQSQDKGPAYSDASENFNGGVDEKPTYDPFSDDDSF